MWVSSRRKMLPEGVVPEKHLLAEHLRSSLVVSAVSVVSVVSTIRFGCSHKSWIVHLLYSQFLPFLCIEIWEFTVAL